MYKKLQNGKDFFSLFLRELLARFRKHGIAYTSGQVAYFFILSMFPFLIFMNFLIASLNIPSSAAIAFLSPFFPDKISSYIAAYLEYINNNQNKELLSFGIVIALFSSSKSVRSLIHTFDLAYESKSKRCFLCRMLFSSIYILLFGISFLICMIIVALGNGLLFNMIERLSLRFEFIDIFLLWRWVTAGIILFLVLSVTYKILPSSKVPFRETFPGSSFSLCGMLLLTFFFSFYVNHIAGESFIYGSIGAVVLLMLWMYFAGMILILGAEINKCVHDFKKARDNS